MRKIPPICSQCYDYDSSINKNVYADFSLVLPQRLFKPHFLPSANSMTKVILLCVTCLTLEFVLAKQDEKNILAQFREKVLRNLTKDYMKTDFYLTKWLKATEYNVDDAEEMLLENLKWRNENNMDNSVYEDYSDMEPDFPAYTDTKDKQGRPVCHINFGKWDLRGAAVHGKLPRLRKYMYEIFESLDRQVWNARAAELNISSCIIIGDYDGFNEVQHMCSSCLPFLVQMMDCLQSRYPYLAENSIYINVPMKIKVLLNAASVVLRKDFLDTFTFLTEKSKWLPYLDERIDRDQRYTNAGGTREAQ